MVLQFRWKKDFLLHKTYLKKTLRILTSIFDWLYFTQYLTSFSSIDHLLCHYAVFDSIWSNIDEVLSISPSANVFVFGDFNVHHEDWLTYADGTDRPGELCYNFFISNDLTQTVNFLTRITDWDSHFSIFWICFFLPTLVFVLQWLSLHWKILIMLLSQFQLTFQ